VLAGGNNEEQYYTNRASNVIVEGGYLKIKTIKESYLGSNFTSARILSKDKFSFKYGKVEFRAKLPAGGGTWPTLWMGEILERLVGQLAEKLMLWSM
jgi:beta-glucanase (GH16 family)